MAERKVLPIKIRIGASPMDVRIEVGGQDVTNFLEGVSFTAAVGQTPRAHLDFLCMGPVEIETEAEIEILKRKGAHVIGGEPGKEPS